MDIIALLLHISWDRKCSYQILVSEAEAETVVCSCFRIAPDLELPAVKPERGSTDFVRGWGGVLTYRVDAQTHKTTHYGHTCDAKMPIFLLSWTNPYAQHRKEPSSVAQTHTALSKLTVNLQVVMLNQTGKGEKKLLWLKENCNTLPGIHRAGKTSPWW